MENIENETNKNHPEPSEDIQLDIETVIPDTEEVIPPSVSPGESEKSEETEEIQEPQETEEIQEPQETDETQESQEDHEPQPEQPAVQEENEGEEDDSEDDIRDDIETVSP